MMKRFVRSTLALLLCCAMLMSNLGFAQELTELAEELAPAESTVEVTEPAPETEAEPEQEAEPEPEPEPEAEPQGEAEPGEAAPGEEGEVCEHRWSEGEEPYCVLCGKSDFCEHPAAAHRTVFNCPAGTGTDNGDGTHAATYFGEEYMYCEDCGAIWARESTGETKEATAEAHVWETLDGATFCGICGAEQPEQEVVEAPAEEVVEEVVEEEPAPELIWDPSMEEAAIEGEPLVEESADAIPLGAGYAGDNGGCLEDGHEMNCFDHMQGEYCTKCGYTDKCDHTRKSEGVRDETYEREEGATDNGDGTHTVTYKVATYNYCPTCGARWAYKVTEETTQVKDEPHEWEDGHCTVCNAVNDCDHEDYIESIGEFYDYMDFDDAQGDSKDDGHGQHTVHAVLVKQTRCTKCGEVFTERGEEEIITEPHRWDENDSTRCWVCGYVNTCQNHEGVPVEDQDPWLEDYDSSVVIKTDDEQGHAPDKDGHFRKGMGYQTVECATCHNRWDEYTEVYVWEEHEWNEDGTACTACDYTIPAESCHHPDARWEESGHRIPYEGLDPNDEKYPEDLGDGKHKVWGVLGHEWWCPDCDMRWGFEPDEGDSEHWFIEDHQFNGVADEDNNPICWVCGGKGHCDHENPEDHREIEWEDGSPKPDDSNILQHKGLGRWKSWQWCPDCECEINVHYDTAEPVELTEPHDWGFQNDGTCWVCKDTNKCDHTEAKMESEVFQGIRWDDEHPEDNGDGTHTGRGAYATWKYCNVCECDFDIQWQDGGDANEPKWKTYTFPHNWDEGEETHCMDCGADYGCDHSDRTEIQSWSELDEEAAENAGAQNAVVTTTDTEHTAYIKKLTQYVCNSCGTVFTVEQTFNAPRTEEHSWAAKDRKDQKGESACTVCGKESTCTHENSDDWYTLYEPVDTEHPIIKSMDENGHTMMTVTWTMKHCKDCGIFYNIQSSEAKLEEHVHFYGLEEAGEELQDTCMWCGYNRTCEHKNKVPVSRIIWDYGPYNAGDKHEGMGRHATGTWCPDCESYITLSFTEDEPGWISLEHTQDGDDFETDFEAYDDEINEEDEEYQNATSHKVKGRFIDHKHCDVCDVDFDVVRDGYHTGPHEWNGEDGTTCWVCGYKNPCDHEGTTELVDEWVEPNYDHEDYIVMQNAISHEVYALRFEKYRCTNCNAEWTELTSDEDFTVSGRHEYNAEDGASYCRLCGYENPCHHEEYDILDGDEGFVPGPNFNKLDPVDGEECHVFCTHWFDARCRLCKVEFHIEDNNFEYQGPHIWNEDGKTCSLCGAKNECQHEEAYTHYFVSRDDDQKDEGIFKSNADGHEVAFRVYSEEICPDCGLHFGWNYDIDMGNTDIVSEEKVKEYLANDGIDVSDVTVTIADNEYKLSGPHAWNGEDGGYECLFCGWENSCNHENAEDLDDRWYDWIDGRSECVYQDGERHIFEHVQVHSRFYCPTCDTVIVFTNDDDSWEAEHCFKANVGEDGAVQPNAECDDPYCDFAITCSHLVNHRETWYEVPENAQEPEFTSDQQGHTGMLQEVQETYCDMCGAAWNKTYGAAKSQKAPHDWYYDEESKKICCETCGWVNACPHNSKAEQVGYWYDWDGATVKSTTATQHTMRKACKVEQFYWECEECDCGSLFYEVRTPNQVLTDNHEWDYETGGSKCVVCGYTNPCKHPAEKVGFETWFDPDDARGGITAVDAKTHTWYKMEVGEYRCYACGASWGWQEVGPVGDEEDPPVPEDHEWNEDGYCNLCSYENKCTHEGKDIYNTWYEKDTVTAFDKNGHTATGTRYEEWYCSKCNMNGTDVTRGVALPTEHEWDDENKGKTCRVCGYTNPCKHPATMVHTETWEEPDRENYPHEGVVTSGADRCTVYVRTVQETYCDQCGACYGWKVVKSGYKRSDVHEWHYDENEDRTYCEWCNADSTCKHERCDVLDKWYADVWDDDHEGKFTITDTEHSYDVYTYELRRCQDCGFEFEARMNGGETKKLSEKHNWHWDREKKQTFCINCGARTNTCTHPNAEVHKNVWYDIDDLKGGIISVDANGHTGHFFEVKGYYCPDCNTDIDVEFPDNDSKKFTLPHDWSYDQNGAYCSVCGYKNKCTHAKATVEYDGIDIGIDGDNSSSDPKQHTVKGTYWQEMHCPSCGAYYRVEQNNYTLTGAHRWIWDRDLKKCVCEICGEEYADNKTSCTHPNKETNIWLDANLTVENRQYIMSNRTATSHKVPAKRITEEFCPDCDGYLSRKEEPLADVYIDGPHEWDEGGFCRYCGYQNSCTNHTAMVDFSYDALPEKIQIISQTSSTHTVVMVTYEESICKKCGLYMGEKLKAKSEHQVTQLHQFDENGVCQICGWEAQTEFKCSHPAEFVDPETIFEPIGDQFTVRTATEHTAYGVEYTQNHCKLCDAYYNTNKSDVILKTEKHHWDGMTGTQCYICGYKNPCNHANKTEKIRGTSAADNVTVYISELATGRRHASITRTATFTQCKSCGAKFGYTYKIGSVVMADHVYDNDSDKICNICGFDRTNVVLLTKMSFEAAADGIILGVGEKYTPVLTKNPPNAKSEVTFSGGKSGSTKVFAVNADTGEITAKAVGTAKLTATCTDNGDVLTAELTVTVMKKPGSITLEPNVSTLNMANGTSTGMKAVLPNKSAGRITWTSSNPEVAEYVEENGVGKVQAKSLGTAIITATVYSGKSASCAVNVLEPLNSNNVELELSTSTMVVGETATATVELIDSYGEYEVVSANPSFVTVEEKSDGEYTLNAAGQGTATIQVKTVGASTTVLTSKTITVYPAPTSVEIANLPANKLMGLGETLEPEFKANDGYAYLDYCNPVVTSNKPAIIAVDPVSGKLTAKKTGKAKITVKVGNYTSDAVLITVKKAPTSIKLKPTTVSMYENEKLDLTAILSDGSAGTVAWFSDNTDVVTVDNGTLTAVGAGSATVTASVYNSKNASKPLTAMCSVSVYKVPEEGDMELNLSATVLGKKETIKVAPSYEGEAGGEYTLIAVAADGNVTQGAVTINQKKGTIKGDALGKVKIQAVYDINDDLTQRVVRAEETIEIKRAPTEVALKRIEKEEVEDGSSVTTEVALPKSLKMMPNESFEMKPVIVQPDNAASALTVSTSKASIVEIEPIYDEDDQHTGTYIVHAMKAGSATITVKAFNGTKATCKISVKKSPESIKLKKTSLDMIFDENGKYTSAPQTIKAKVTPSDYAGTLEWFSSDERVATVDNNGKITPQGQGVVYISARIFNHEIDDYIEADEPCEVLVCEVPRSGKGGNISLSSVKEKIGVNESTNLRVDYNGSTGDVKKYEVVGSKNGEIVSVNKKTGKVTGKAVGTAHLKATMFNDVVIETTIEVVAAPNKIEIVEDDKPITTLTLEMGEEYVPEYRFTKQKNGQPVDCEASVTLSQSSTDKNRKIVSLVKETDEDGNSWYKIVALKKTGTVTITAKTHNGKTCKLKVTVVAATN